MTQGKRRADWLDQVLAFLPPRLHRWFTRKWAEPAAWHSARLAFARTAAVWSMVGHICGLGDRHGARGWVTLTTSPDREPNSNAGTPILLCDLS